MIRVASAPISTTRTATRLHLLDSGMCRATASANAPSRIPTSAAANARSSGSRNSTITIAIATTEKISHAVFELISDRSARTARPGARPQLPVRGLLRTRPMLAEWLAPITVDEFACGYLHRSAWALPHSARSALDVLDWDTVDEVLRAAPPPDVIVCAKGTPLPF